MERISQISMEAISLKTNVRTYVCLLSLFSLGFICIVDTLFCCNFPSLKCMSFVFYLCSCSCSRASLYSIATMERRRRQTYSFLFLPFLCCPRTSICAICNVIFQHITHSICNYFYQAMACGGDGGNIFKTLFFI